MIFAVLDGTSTDLDVTRTASQIGRHSKLRVVLLYVIEIGRDRPVDQEISEKTAKGEEILSNMEKLAKNHKVKTSGQLLQARSRGSAVVAHCKDEEADMIVVASPVSTRFGEYSIGESLEYILSNATCKVVTCRASI